jgi:hypothetical protein
VKKGRSATGAYTHARRAQQYAYSGELVHIPVEVVQRRRCGRKVEVMMREVDHFRQEKCVVATESASFRFLHIV